MKASETFARELIDDIVRRGLDTGARLPTEATLVQDYRCSRQSVREGLRLLEVSGLVTMHRGVGGGPRLGRVDPGNLGRMATLFLHLAGATHDELFDALITAESLLAERAAGNPDRAAVEAAMRPHLQHPDRAELSKADFIVEHTEFHATIAALAGNRVLVDLPPVHHPDLHPPCSPNLRPSRRVRLDRERPSARRRGRARG